MNKAPSTLLEGIVESIPSPAMDDINPTLQQYQLRPGIPYYSPAHITTAVNGPFGVPYWMQGLAIQTTNNMYIDAPQPFQASTITHPAETLYSAGQYGIGSAPVSGIYTGVEEVK